MRSAAKFRATEHELQEQLLPMWKANGLKVDAHVFFLIGDEIQENWCPNRWIEGAGAAQPSIDYLFADAAGQLWALELKPGRRAYRPALELLLQISLRASALSLTLSMENLQKVYDWTYGPGNLPRAHQAFYNLPTPIIEFGAGQHIHRLVAGPGLGEDVVHLRHNFHGQPLSAVKALAARYGRNPRRISEIRRLDWFCDAAAWDRVANTELWIIDLASVDGNLDGTGRRIVSSGLDNNELKAQTTTPNAMALRGFA